jgi:uncharacterized membrane protein
MEEIVDKERLTAFSDGVVAILITIMVLDLRIPQTTDSGALAKIAPVFLCYVLSFIYIAIYWNNHHHMFYTVKRVDGLILWANMNLLFWLSLLPFATAWMGENNFASVPTAIYGVTLLMPAIAYYLLQRAIIRLQGPGSALAKAIGKDVKGKLSPVFYIAAIALTFINPGIAHAIYVLVALMWIVPDRRIEKALGP